MQFTNHMIIAGAAALLGVALTAGPLLNVGTSFTIDNTEMKIQPRKDDLTVVPASKAANPLVDDLSVRASANPFTGKPNSTVDTRLPPPPAPPLELPLPPALPLQEK